MTTVKEKMSVEQKQYHTRNKEIRKSFAKHVATVETHGPYTQIVWAEPGTSNYKVVYTFRGNSLFIEGDLGEAIFHRAEGLDFWAGCNLNYYMEKCEASAYGREARTWDKAVAKDYLKTMWKDHELPSEVLKEFGEYHEYEKEQMHQLIRDLNHGDSEIDAMILESGEVVPYHMQAHWLGLKMVKEQLDAKTT